MPTLPVSAGTPGTAVSATVVATPFPLAIPATNAEDDLLVAVICVKMVNAPTPTATNWTLMATSTKFSSGTAAATGVGEQTIFVMGRVVPAGGLSGSVSFTITGADSVVGRMMVYSYTNPSGLLAPTWEVAVAASTSFAHASSTTWGGTGAANINLDANDYFLVALGVADDTARDATPGLALTATGTTLGTLTDIGHTTVTTSTDCALTLMHRSVTAGPSSAAPAATLFGGAAETGGGLFLRVRATGDTAGSVARPVLAGVDDGSFDVVGSGYSNTGTNFVVGDSSGSVYNKSVFMRFTNMTIPAGATVSAATLTIPAVGGSVTPFQTVFIRAEAADNPATVTTRADGLARTKTTAVASWSGMTSISTGNYTTVDFTSVVQEVISRGGWVSGNAIQLFLSSDSTSFGTAWQIAFGTFNSATSSPATLNITYTTGTNYDKNQPDAEDITDVADRALDAARTQPDAVGVTDLAAQVADSVRAQSDPVGVTDAVSAVMSIDRSISDAVGLTDSASNTLDTGGGFARTVGSSADDGSFDVVGAGYSNAGTFVVVGDSSGSIYNKSAFFRFTNVTLTQGQTVSAATLTIPAVGGSATPLQTVFIRAEAADNATAATSRADALARTKTTAVASWSGMTAIASGNYTTVDISAVIQEVVNRGGWVSGNAIQFFLSSDSGSFGTAWQIAFGTIDTTSPGSLPATLNVTTSASLTQSPADTEGVTDVATRALDAARTQGDPVGLTDVAGRALDSAHTQSDPVGVTDAATATQDFVRSQPDSVGVTDATAVGTDYVRTVGDSVGLTDTATPSLVSGMAVTINDNVGIFDTDTDQTFEWDDAANEPLGIADVATAGVDGVRTQTDGVGVNDATSLLSTSSRDLTEPLGITDSVDAFLTIPYIVTMDDHEGITDTVDAVLARVLTITVNDTVGLSDLVTPNLTTLVADSVGITDSASALLAVGGNAVDPVGITDSATASQSSAKTAADPVGITDTVSALLGWDVSLPDSVGLSDTVSVLVSGVRLSADPVGITDTAASALTFSRTPADPVGITDLVTGTFGNDRTPTDPVGVTDAVSFVMNRLVTIADGVALNDGVIIDFIGVGFALVPDQIDITDSLDSYWWSNKTSNDPVTIGDLVSTAMARDKWMETDYVGIGDALSVVAGATQAKNDPLAVYETLMVSLDALRPPSDPVGLTDVVSAVLAVGELGEPAEDPGVYITDRFGMRLRPYADDVRLIHP